VEQGENARENYRRNPGCWRGNPWDSAAGTAGEARMFEIQVNRIKSGEKAPFLTTAPGPAVKTAAELNHMADFSWRVPPLGRGLQVSVSQ